MLRTRVGYAGGTTPTPNYQKIGDHTEVVELDFDPATITYSDLLVHFFKWHDAFRKAYSPQYKSLILYHDSEQKAEIDAFRERLGVGAKRLATDIQPYEGMTIAEDYHQKYYIRRSSEVGQELVKNFSSFREFVDSRQAAVVNGILAGYRPSPETLSNLNLDPKMSDLLRQQQALVFR